MCCSYIGSVNKCVIMAKSLNLFGTKFPHLENEDNNNDLAEGITSMCVQCPACLLYSVTASN